MTNCRRNTTVFLIKMAVDVVINGNHTVVLQPSSRFVKKPQSTKFFRESTLKNICYMLSNEVLFDRQKRVVSLSSSCDSLQQFVFLIQQPSVVTL